MKLDLNPLFSIWFYPRITARELLKNPPDQLAFNVCVLSSLSVLLLCALGSTAFPPILTIWIFLGVLVAISPLMACLFYFGACKITHYFLGRFGHDVSIKDLRMAFGIGQIPMLTALIFWIPMLIVFDLHLFLDASFGAYATEAFAHIARDIHFFLCIFFLIWGAITTVAAMAEVSKAPFRNVLLVTLISELIITSPLLIFWGIKHFI